MRLCDLTLNQYKREKVLDVDSIVNIDTGKVIFIDLVPKFKLLRNGKEYTSRDKTEEDEKTIQVVFENLNACLMYEREAELVIEKMLRDRLPKEYLRA